MKSILFIDPPAFRTTVEGLDDPRLRHRPVAISPFAADRAILLAVSAEARAAGVERGMAVTLARKICPDLIVRPPNPRRYARAHRALYQILARVAPVIEPCGWGHAYLDLTGTERLFGSATDVAQRLERETRAELHLPLAVGVATNKLVSVTAAAVIKREAGAEVHTIPAGKEAAFLAPEPVTYLPDLPELMRLRLDEYHLDRIGDIAAIGETMLRRVFGVAGRTLHNNSCGIDYRLVLSPEVRAACQVSLVLATDTNDRDTLRAALRPLAERLGRRLRSRHFAAGRLVLMLRHSDDVISKQSVRLLRGALDIDLWRAAASALDVLLMRRVTVRSFALLAEELRDTGDQCELWPDLQAILRPRDVALQRLREAGMRDAGCEMSLRVAVAARQSIQV